MTIYQGRSGKNAYGVEPLCSDVCPLDHGGTYIIRHSPERTLGDVTVLEIQPVVAYVGSGEACEVGHPWWCVESYIDTSTFAAAMAGKHEGAMLFLGIHPGKASAEEIAYALHAYGDCRSDWWGGWKEDMRELRGIATYHEWRAAEAEFREMVREASR